VIDKPDGDEEEYGRQGKLSLNQILALKALRQAVEDHGEPAPNGIRAGSGGAHRGQERELEGALHQDIPTAAEVASRQARGRGQAAAAARRQGAAGRRLHRRRQRARDHLADRQGRSAEAREQADREGEAVAADDEGGQDVPF
jgi:hypothetical protein